MLMQVASTTWGPSGLLGIFVMTQGPRGAISSIACYLIGLLISYVMSFVLTNALVSADEITPTSRAETVKPAEAAPSGTHKTVKHGDPISFDDTDEKQSHEFCFTVKDPIGLHARPAGELAKIIKKYDCHFVIEANGRTAENGSIMQIMALGASSGSTLKCRAEGNEAAQAIKEVQRFMQERL